MTTIEEEIGLTDITPNMMKPAKTDINRKKGLTPDHWWNSRIALYQLYSKPGNQETNNLKKPNRFLNIDSSTRWWIDQTLSSSLNWNNISSFRFCTQPIEKSQKAKKMEEELTYKLTTKSWGGLTPMGSTIKCRPSSGGGGGGGGFPERGKTTSTYLVIPPLG
jgi:hypothetical protein